MKNDRAPFFSSVRSRAISLSERIGRGRGFTLAEMVVAVGVSAVFVLMLSSLLAQTLSVSSNLQDQLYAVAVAEVAIENAKSTPFGVLNSYAGLGKQELKVNLDNSPSSVPRLPPIQLDLTSLDTLYGAVDAKVGQIEPDRKWTIESGNFFHGRVEETITNIKDKLGFDAVQVVVDVSYTIGGKESKRISRSIIVLNNEE